MNMVTMNLAIPMMVTTLVIKPFRIKLWLRLLFIALFREQYLHQADSRQITIHPTYQSLCNEQYSKKVGGQITIHEQ